MKQLKDNTRTTATLHDNKLLIKQNIRLNVG